MGEARIDVAALTQGVNTPSARFRVRQFVPALRHHGIFVSEHSPVRTPFRHAVSALRNSGRPRAAIPLQWLDTLFGRGPGLAAAYHADLTWISKQLVPGLPTLEKILPRPMVLDVDDAMWLARPFGEAAARAAARVATCVVVGSRHLAEYYSQYNSNVHYIPTSIDLTRFLPKQNSSPSDPFVIGWTGSRTTLPFLESLDHSLSSFMRRTGARLRVLCDAQPNFTHVPPDQVDFVDWTPAAEAAVLQEVDVGIMPLPDTPLARGKCSFKMLQYMATALPVIVSPVGANADILASADIGWAATSEEEWTAAFEACCSDRVAASQKGARGRLLVERDFNHESAATKLARVFRIALGSN